MLSFDNIMNYRLNEIEVKLSWLKPEMNVVNDKKKMNYLDQF